jgi:lipid-A-disaccharide synthase-like uncharacterized protein
MHNFGFLDYWVAFGVLGQVIFALRFVIQWIASEKKKESYIPLFFWYLSLTGSIILLIYAIHRRDPVFILGQSTGFIVYIRNLMLIYRKKLQFPAAGSDVASHQHT